MQTNILVFGKPSEGRSFAATPEGMEAYRVYKEKQKSAARDSLRQLNGDPPYSLMAYGYGDGHFAKSLVEKYHMSIFDLKEWSGYNASILEERAVALRNKTAFDMKQKLKRLTAVDWAIAYDTYVESHKKRIATLKDVTRAAYRGFNVDIEVFANSDWRRAEFGFVSVYWIEPYSARTNEAKVVVGIQLAITALVCGWPDPDHLPLAARSAS